MTGVLIAAVIAAVWYYVRTFGDFAPFNVRITVTRAGLLNFGLATAAQLDALTNVSDKSPLVRGVAFSLLRIGLLSDQGTLVYWNDWQSFTTTVETEVEFLDLSAQAPEMVRSLGIDTVCPSLFLRRDDGLAIGLATWSSDQAERQVIATLPWAVFDVPQWRSGRMSAKKLAGRLKELGWKQDPREIGDSQPNRLTHKYASVEWHYL